MISCFCLELPATSEFETHEFVFHHIFNLLPDLSYAMVVASITSVVASLDERGLIWTQTPCDFMACTIHLSLHL